MKRYQQILTCAFLLPLLAGCVDDKYDLSDIDTTVKVNVDNLTIPVNIDEITLGNIIKPNENQIELIDGQYAIVYDGSFVSQGVKIDAISLQAPTITPSETTINLISSGTLHAQESEYTYQLTGQPSDFQYSSSSTISDFILSINRIGLHLQLDINISMRGLENLISRITFKDVVLQLPKGLNLTDSEGGSYNPANGELTLPSSITVQGTTMSLSIIADALDFQQAGGTFDPISHQLTLPGSMYIKSGYGVISSDDITAGNTTLPQQITLHTGYTLHDTKITSFSGTINRYNIDGANLSDIDLSDLPDILSQQSTDITLANPMIYLQISNPLQPYGNLYAETALKIEASRNNTTATSRTSDIFSIGRPASNNGIYNLCLSPATPIADTEFPDAKHVTFASLGSILSGNGIPKALSVSLDNPNLPANQTVTDFPLTGPANEIGSFNGKYKFVAPLQFSQGSTITYNDKIDGWYSEDMDHLTITDLEISLIVSTDIPVGVEFEGHPINTAGQPINNVQIVGANLQPNADRQQITIRITGEITALDGVSFVAKAHATGGETLTPDMSITLTDIRPSVSGYYEKEL